MIASAKLMTETFEKILTTAQASDSKDAFFVSVPEDLTKAFPVLLQTYLHDFHLWKAPDQEKTSRRIIHALTALFKSYDLLLLKGEAHDSSSIT